MWKGISQPNQLGCNLCLVNLGKFLLCTQLVGQWHTWNIALDFLKFFLQIPAAQQKEVMEKTEAEVQIKVLIIFFANTKISIFIFTIDDSVIIMTMIMIYISSEDRVQHIIVIIMAFIMVRMLRRRAELLSHLTKTKSYISPPKFIAKIIKNITFIIVTIMIRTQRRRKLNYCPTWQRLNSMGTENQASSMAEFLNQVELF